MESSSFERELAYRRALQRVRARLGLFAHATLWLVVAVLCIALNAVLTPGMWWFWWPVLFWLVALALHGATVVGPGAKALEQWRDREIRRELERSGYQFGGDH